MRLRPVRDQPRPCERRGGRALQPIARQRLLTASCRGGIHPARCTPGRAARATPLGLGLTQRRVAPRGARRSYLRAASPGLRQTTRCGWRRPTSARDRVRRARRPTAGSTADGLHHGLQRRRLGVTLRSSSSRRPHRRMRRCRGRSGSAGFGAPVRLCRVSRLSGSSDRAAVGAENVIPAGVGRVPPLARVLGVRVRSAGIELHARRVTVGGNRTSTRSDRVPFTDVPREASRTEDRGDDGRPASLRTGVRDLVDMCAIRPSKTISRTSPPGSSGTSSGPARRGPWWRRTRLLDRAIHRDGRSDRLD